MAYYNRKFLARMAPIVKLIHQQYPELAKTSVSRAIIDAFCKDLAGLLNHHVNSKARWDRLRVVKPPPSSLRLPSPEERHERARHDRP
jgi:hypothetical protein